MKNNLFSYRYDTTIIHKIPAIIKIFFLCFVSIRIFSQFNPEKVIESFFQCGFYFLIGCLLFILAKTKFSSLKNLSFIFIIGFFIILLNGINFENKLNFDFKKSLEGVLYLSRLLTTSLIALIVFDTTSVYQLENDLDKIPLFKKFKISQTISLTILFIPLIFRTWNKIQLASKSRNIKNKNSLILKLQNLFQSFSTLFSCILNSAENTRKAILNRKFN
jgi:biotin transport system permease protein